MLCTGPVQEGYAVIFLETERLTLRNLLPQDAETMFDYRNNEICARYQRGQTRDQAGIVQLIARRGSDMLSADAPLHGGCGAEGDGGDGGGDRGHAQ